MAKKGKRPPPGSGGISPRGGTPPKAARGGMPDMQQLMRQAAEMQAQMQEKQAALAEETFEGSSGGGVVTAVVKGTGEVLSVTIDPMVLDPDDPEMVGDLVVAAVNQAIAAIAESAAESMNPGMDLGDIDLGDLGGLLG